MAVQEPKVVTVPVERHIPVEYVAPGWKVIQPLPVTIEQDDDGYYIVSDDIFAVYGDGETLDAALQDYIISLIDYYEILAARAEGDPPTQALFNHLKLYLRAAAE